MSEIRCPLKGKAVLDLYFLENRARILEIASFLDRINRCDAPEVIRDDCRYRSLVKALNTVAGPHPNLTEAVQLIFSDLTEQPADKAGAPAIGAWKGLSD